MRSVRFNDAVSVYELNDACEDRHSSCIFAAVDRRPFERRIARTSLILELILTEEHRLLMWLRTIRLRN